MMDRLAALIVDEGNWLPLSMLLALLSVAFVLYRKHDSELSSRLRIAAAMNLFFGVTIAIMAFGHLLAVSVKLASGDLQGFAVTLYAIGIALSVPAWALIFHARKLLSSHVQARKTWILNAWLAITLLLLGLHNLPLAVPALFNISYQLHSRRAVGWAILSMAVVIHLGLFIGSLIFLASGQTFEQFTGVQ